MKNRLLVPLLFGAVLGSFVERADAAAEHDHDHQNNHDHKGPFYGHFHVRIHADAIVNAQEADEEFNELYSHSHLFLGMRLGEGFSLHSNIKLEGEPAGHNHGHDNHVSDGDDRLFKDHPLLVEQLTLNYDNEHFSAYIGKFNPVVGFDYHHFPGLYGYQAIEAYAIRERIGFGAAVKHHAGAYGTHRLDASTFFADTTLLCDSILYQRSHTSEEDGGVANTRDFSSYAVALSGSDFYALSNNIIEGISYRVGYAKQAAAVSNEEDETRYSVSLKYKHVLSRDVTAEFLAEHMNIDHLGGEIAHDRAYSTAAFRLNYQQWNLATSYSIINNSADEEDENYDGNIYQISAGYTFKNGIGLDFGFQRSDEDNEVTDRLGGLVSYSFEF